LLVEHMNNLASEGQQEDILVVFDEFADAVLNSTKATILKKLGLKTLEENMRALAQKGRSIGFRIVSAMQRADSNVITGTSKVNFPVQICYRVKSQIDSKVVLDEPGAECLSGYGDGLIKSPEYNDTVRFQSYYLDPKRPIMAHYDGEVNATVVTA
jgi:S-DNA-T family DNA segregation ATPase FtsK/SpoIIIE